MDSSVHSFLAYAQAHCRDRIRTLSRIGFIDGAPVSLHHVVCVLSPAFPGIASWNYRSEPADVLPGKRETSLHDDAHRDEFEARHHSGHRSGEMPGIPQGDRVEQLAARHSARGPLRHRGGRGPSQRHTPNRCAIPDGMEPFPPEAWTSFARLLIGLPMAGKVTSPARECPSTFDRKP